MTLTPEQELLLDCWEQWAYRTFYNPDEPDMGKQAVKAMHGGGLSTLEDVGHYLRERKIINKKGLTNWRLCSAAWCTRTHRWIDLIGELPEGCPFTATRKERTHACNWTRN